MIATKAALGEDDTDLDALVRVAVHELLVGAVGLDIHHFVKAFKKIAGETPGAYHRANQPSG
jgi:hypothetical protein